MGDLDYNSCTSNPKINWCEMFVLNLSGIQMCYLGGSTEPARDSKWEEWGAI